MYAPTLTDHVQKWTDYENESVIRYLWPGASQTKLIELLIKKCRVINFAEHPNLDRF